MFRYESGWHHAPAVREVVDELDRGVHGACQADIARRLGWFHPLPPARTRRNFAPSRTTPSVKLGDAASIHGLKVARKKEGAACNLTYEWVEGSLAQNAFSER